MKRLVKKAVFLDRDGILNKLVNNRPPWFVEEVDFFNEIDEIIRLIKERNHEPIIVTNQPDAARGDADLNSLKEVQKYISNHLKIKYKYTCYHPYDGMCLCRKPLPGMLFEAARENDINLKKSFMIGDREKDIIAGATAGCTTIYLAKTKDADADFFVKDHQSLYKLLSKLLII